jgi:hypothetical protein
MAAAARTQSLSRMKTVVAQAQVQSPPKTSVINTPPSNAAAITNTLGATIITLEIKMLEDLLERGGISMLEKGRWSMRSRCFKGILGRIEKEE